MTFRQRDNLMGSGCLHIDDNLFISAGKSLIDNVPTSVYVDDNEEIIRLIVDRLELGKNRYKQGIRHTDDTRKFGCRDDSWLEMELEEVLDGMVYTAASLLRLKRNARVKQLRL
tara:strand:- start:1055 stop:1396 length:342 start_codon:yes stop_codon:yes gene_type:complete